MSANSFGQIFKITSFGESHGKSIGVLIEGCPAGVPFDVDLLNNNLQRRRPGQSSVTTARDEQDEPILLSGVFENKTLGTPICLIVNNIDKKSKDYDEIKDNPRVGHADDTWKLKFKHVDYRGGGRSSGRETVSRVLAGSVAQMLVQKINSDIKVLGYVSSIGSFHLSDADSKSIWSQKIDSFPTRFPSVSQQDQVIQLLEQAKIEGESYGGIIDLRIRNVPPGLGQPVFHKFKADLAAAMLSIGATIAIELGEGFDSAEAKGTEFHHQNNSSKYGGVRGGITTGEEIFVRIVFKPTSSINSVSQKGRHDPCIVTRAVPVVESMAWLLLADHLLWCRLDTLE
ncbi:MAG: chorismate synthase [Pseudobdellovibrio sp.]